MGARKSSINNEKASQKEIIEVSRIEACKRQRTSSSFWNENPRLFPGLPDEISIQILARVPRLWHFNAKQVSRSWRAAIMSGEIYRLRKELGTTEEWLYILTRIGHYKFMWLALDPVYQIWQKLPPMHDHATEDCTRRGLSGFRMRNSVDPSSRIAGGNRGIEGWLGLKDMCQIPYFGCDICAVNSCLYVLGGFCRRTAMRSVWRYDPSVNSWSEVAPMCTSRAYCNTGVLNNKLYAVGGVTRASGRARLMIPLQCAEVFDPCSGTWSKIPSMPFSKARTLPTPFLPELVKPIATGTTSYRGKLYVRQSLNCRPHCIDAGGEVYDPESNSWVDMPIGLGKGWPVRQADTKPSVIVVVDDELYALDRSDSVDNAQIKVYDHQDDAWKAIERDVPDRNLNDPQSPFLLAGLLGKLHVITKDVNHNIKVMQADRQQNQFASASIGESWREVPTRSPKSIWKDIATRRAGQDHELVSCQVVRY